MKPTPQTLVSFLAVVLLAVGSDVTGGKALVVNQALQVLRVYEDGVESGRGAYRDHAADCGQGKVKE